MISHFLFGLVSIEFKTRIVIQINVHNLCY